MKLQIFPLVLTMLVGAACVGRPAETQAAAKTKLLIITGGHGFANEPFFQVFKDNVQIAFTATAHGKTNADAWERADLLSYDAVLLYDMPKTITDAQKAKMLSLFDKGVGLFVLHHALVSYQHWPE